MTKIELAKAAVRAAAQLRAKFGIGPGDALCPYDLAVQLEIKVSFIAASSLEGAYSPDPTPAIVLSSVRPAGRRRYTCGHEIGHHVFGHGCRVDELDEDGSPPWSPEEFLAQRFSSALLMPKIAVDAAFSKRGWTFSTAKPEQVYVIAQEFGVGYTTLISNAEMNLNCISGPQADALRRIPLAKIREALVGSTVSSDVFVLDRHWARRTVDVEVGDLIILPSGVSLKGKCATPIAGSTHLVATAQGIENVTLTPGTSAISLRVSKRGFTGLARYRHLEDEDDDE